MEEKNLTDEEIVKAFERGSQNHGYFNEINGKGVKYEDVFDLIHRQKAEIERLTEYNANLNGMCLEFTDKNAELQKQVDELTRKNQAFEKVIDSYKDGEFSSKMIVNGLNNFYEPIVKDTEEQAVKGTSKEILTELIERAHSNGCIDLTVNEVKAWFREDYGVEV